MCPGEDRRGGTAAMSSVECGQCGHATGDHWHWRLYTDSPGSQAGCGGDRFNSGWAELSGLKVIGAIKMCTLKTAASRATPPRPRHRSCSRFYRREGSFICTFTFSEEALTHGRFSRESVSSYVTRDTAGTQQQPHNHNLSIRNVFKIICR